MPSAAVLKVKQAYNDKICKLLDDHDRAFLVHADNVGSRQFMDIRAVRHPSSCLKEIPFFPRLLPGGRLFRASSS